MTHICHRKHVVSIFTRRSIHTSAQRQTRTRTLSRAHVRTRARIIRNCTHTNRHTRILIQIYKSTLTNGRKHPHTYHLHNYYRVNVRSNATPSHSSVVGVCALACAQCDQTFLLVFCPARPFILVPPVDEKRKKNNSIPILLAFGTPGVQRKLCAQLTCSSLKTRTTSPHDKEKQ